MTLALLCDNKGPSAVYQQTFRTALTLNFLYGLNSFKGNLSSVSLMIGCDCKRGLNICIAGLSEKNWKENVLRIELNFYHAIKSKSLDSSSFPL